MSKRIVEIFVAGCLLCDETVKEVQGILCPSCDLRILDLRTDKSAQTKAAECGITRVPAVTIDGNLASCCAGKSVDIGLLKSLGVGEPL
ncbi:MAG: hypothetical protein AB1772_06350 [Candidatus Zixiibacteriota bacterium]